MTSLVILIMHLSLLYNYIYLFKLLINLSTYSSNYCLLIYPFISLFYLHIYIYLFTGIHIPCVKLESNTVIYI